MRDIKSWAPINKPENEFPRLNSDPIIYTCYNIKNKLLNISSYYIVIKEDLMKNMNGKRSLQMEAVLLLHKR